MRLEGFGWWLAVALMLNSLIVDSFEHFEILDLHGFAMICPLKAGQ